jgi:TfoX/Sxy family transcriptional regulator of competence genes
VAYDEDLAGRTRELLAELTDFDERKMFGGLAFMVNTHMACGIVHDELMVRVGKDNHDTAINAGAIEMDFTGRPMRGMVIVPANRVRGDGDLEPWVVQAVEFARSEPAKKPDGRHGHGDPGRPLRQPPPPQHPPLSSGDRPNSLDAAGRKSGRWSERDPHGGTMTGEYLDGERVGQWRHFAGDGRLRSEGGYDRGELHGVWTWYRASGTLLQRGAFDQGTKEGAWERWDAQGQPPGHHLVEPGTQTEPERLNAIPHRRATHDDRFPERIFRINVGRTRLSQTVFVCRSNTSSFSVRQPILTSANPALHT